MHIVRRVSAVSVAVLLSTAIALIATPLWGRWRAPSAPPPPGDTVVVYGPHRFSDPNGQGTIGVETFTLTVQPQRRYLLRTTNGNPNGTQRASQFTVVLNGMWILTHSQLGAAHSADRVIQARATDTLQVTVYGDPGAFVDVSVREVSDPTTLVFGPSVVTIDGWPSTRTINFSVDNPGAGAPFYLSLQNGRPDGSHMTENTKLVLNGQTIVTEAEMSNATGLVRQVTLQANNTLQIVAAPMPPAFFVAACTYSMDPPPDDIWCPEMSIAFIGTDVGAPVLTISAPAPNLLTSDATVTVTGTVQDATATTVTANGVVATRNGDAYSAVVPLSEGSNNILVRATDGAGNTRDSTRTVIRDSQAPALTVTAPTDGFATSNPQLTVSGSVSDATTVTVNVNGTPLTVDANGAFSGQITLAAGTNFVTVTATDQATNATSIVRQVSLDTGAPTLTVTAPANNAIIGAAAVTVTGTATDATALTVTVNGTPVTLAGDGSFSTSVELTEGANTITVVATDAASNATTVTRNVTRDTIAPGLGLDAPPDNFQTKHDTIHVRGSVADATPVTVTVNGTPAPVDGAGQFTAVVSLTEGSNTITVIATDGGGNTSSAIRVGISDRTPPTINVTAPADGIVTPQPTVTVTGTVTDATAVTLTVNGNSVTLSGNAFSTSVPLVPGPNTITLVATDAVGNATTVTRSVTRSVVSNDPQLVEVLGIDASLGAPPPAPNVATNISASTRFLYEGPNAVQTGVQPGAILPLKVAVVRGKVTDRDGAPLSGVTVRVTDRPQLGQTQTRANGLFDMAVNGFGQVGINYSKPGYLPVYRQFNVPELDYSTAPEVVLTPLDTAVTTINFTQPIEVARGSVQSDADGARRQTLLFQQGTTAKMVMPNGDSVPLAGPIHVRATEYTVGPNGPNAMPAELPATSGYTYAVELSVDEAMAVGAGTVVLSKPVFRYLENFIELPVGMAVPSAFYDPQKRAWIPSPDGRVVKIHDIVAGSAVLAVDTLGAAHPDTLAAMGVTADELTQLAQLYTVGQTLWRTPSTHFSSHDENLSPSCMQAGATCGLPAVPVFNNAANVKDPAATGTDPECTCTAPGSVILTQQQALGEEIPIIGTPYSLNYQSNRTPGYRAANTIAVQLTGDSPTQPIIISVDLSIGGRKWHREFANQTPISPDFRFKFEWDGLDAYGRPVLGRQPITVRIGHGYLRTVLSYQTTQGINSFGQWVSVTTVTPMRIVAYNYATYTDYIGPWDNRGVGLGGWRIGDHHVYDVTAKRVEMGYGGSARGPDNVSATIRTVVGVPSLNGAFTGDGGPANVASIAGGDHYEFGHDGGLYIAGHSRIRRIGPDGIINTIAGGGTIPTDGSHARLSLIDPQHPQFLPDGSLIFYDNTHKTIRRIGPDSIVRRWAGGGTLVSEEAPALQARLDSLGDMVAAPDGNVYFVRVHRVRQISSAGFVYTVAGSGTCNPASPVSDVSRTTALCLPPPGLTNAPLAVGPEGNLYIVDNLGGGRVRRITTSGRIEPFAFGGPGPGLNGDLALGANVGSIRSIAVGRDGTLYWQDSQNRVRAVAGDGRIKAVAGDGGITVHPEGALAATDYLASAGHDIRIAPDGSVFVADDLRRIRRIGSSFPGLSLTDIPVASQDARDIYIFSGDGLHKRTLDGMTGVTLLTFAYDSSGKLISVTDRNGLVTSVERDANGRPTAIVAPFGQRTVLALGADGMLATVKAPATTPHAMTYDEGGVTGSGLLTTFTDPGTGAHAFAYDSLGRLLSDQNQDGAQTLARVDSVRRYQVTLTNAAGVATTSQVIGLANGDSRQITVRAGGTKADTSDYHPEGGSDHFLADSSWVRNRTAPDTRFGGASAFTADVLLEPRSFAFVNGAQLSATTRVTRVQRVALPITGDLLKPSKIADTVVVGVGANANRSVTNWDAATRSVMVATHLNRRDSTYLDTLGRPTRVASRGLASATLTYDAFGRVTQAARAGRVTRFTFDPQGLVDTIIDPLLFRTQFLYDSAGRPAVVTRSDGQSTAFGYDGEGRLTSITPPGKPLHTFAYTPSGLLQAYTPPTVSGVSDPATRYVYDAAQRLTKIKRPTGDSITFSYDAAGRPNAMTFADGTITTNYHPRSGLPIGMHSTAAPPGGQGTFYEYGGSFLKLAGQGGQVGGAVTYAYDVNLRLASTGVGGSTPTTALFTYDRDDLLTFVEAQTLAFVAFTRSPTTGLVTATNFHGITSALTYDSLGALTSDSTIRSGQTLYSYRFTRDALDRVITKTEIVGGVTTQWGFTYDSAGRLSATTKDGVPSADYDYDPNGNRLSRSTPSGTELGVYDDQDRLISYGGATFLHDAAGMRTTRIVGNDTARYTYDALGALRRVRLPNGTRVDYIIDPLGRRVGRLVDSVYTHRFLYESELRIAAEVNASGQATTRYYYGTKVNVPEFMLRSNVLYRFVTDDLGSVRLVVRQSDGAIMQRIDYDEFGRITLNTNQGFQPFAYAGGLHDDLTGLTRFGQRDYSANEGTWLTPDPVGFAGGTTNLYEYSFADPINNADYAGLQPTFPMPSGPPPVPPPGPGKSGKPNRWVPNPNSSTPERPTFKPAEPVRSPKGAQPRLRWDGAPGGNHWELEDGAGKKLRFDPRGNPVDHWNRPLQQGPKLPPPPVPVPWWSRLAPWPSFPIFIIGLCPDGSVPTRAGCRCAA